ncbi:FlgD immunoglobulin-like domain containing protein [Candidatus Eisenbacteria bacterium]|uniref:FlgD immunoglobulin-like domain containing protein n=1 Tax=Eiseniibacteriota bacterium TaxID=2212470 RepID=A0ABV6YQA8_UNCEI
MRVKHGYWITLALAVCLASILIPEAALAGKTSDTFREHGLRERDFQIMEMGDVEVYFHQRTLGGATVQGDFIVLQYDIQTGELLRRIEHWRDDLPEQLPQLGITMEEAEVMVEGEILFTRLKIIAPGSPVYPIEPTPMNPCWVVRSEVNGYQKVTVIDAVDGTLLGYGVSPPVDAFAVGGPDWGGTPPCDEYYYDPWALNAQGWFNSMGYTAEAVSNPLEATIQGHIQNRTTALFYELCHGSSDNFLHNCPDDQRITAAEVETWIQDYPRMPFTFLGSCGGMCDTGDDAFSYEFRKGTSTGTVTVGFCGMSTPDCAECWDNAMGWQNAVFGACQAGETVSDAVIAANLAFPMCATASCTRFAGDAALTLVPVLPRDPNYPPTALCTDVTVSADADCEAYASIDDGSYDTDGDPITVSQSPSGPYPLGMTLVTLTVTDDRGLSADCTGYVTVIDDTPPDIVCPADITVECSDYCGTPADDPQVTAFLSGASATDNCDNSVDISDDRPACFALDANTVTFTGTDDSGNSESCDAVVNVVDTTPPEISVELSRDVLWPANHKMCEITATIEASDICDSDPTIALVSITSSEPDDSLGDGDEPDDIQLGPNDFEFKLRSERSGLGNGRIYTVTYSVTDGSGNTSVASAEVLVPHDRTGFAMASSGFSATGDGLLPNVDEYVVVIAGLADLPMSEDGGIVVPRAYVGNHIGAIAPMSHRYCFADEDGYMDLELTYDAAATRALQAASGELYPVGLHYGRVDGAAYLVPDIFELGPPLGGSAGVEPGREDTGGVSTSVELFRPIPNPTHGTTLMAYSVSTSNGAQVNISIYSVTGQRVRNLVDGRQGAGVYEAIWDGRDSDGTQVPSGVYFYRSVIGEQTRTSRVTLIR